MADNQPKSWAISLVKLVVSSAVSTVVGNAVRSTTPVTLTPQTRVLTAIGGYILCTMAGRAASDYAEKEIDRMLSFVKKVETEKEKKENGPESNRIPIELRTPEKNC